MIVLDTNVLSELMRPKPSPRVTAWFGELSGELLFTTSVTQAEILFAIALLPQGRHRTDLEKAAARMFAEDFSGRVLPFDGAAAEQFASISAARRERGRPIAPFDAMTAGIASAHGSALASRNVADFEGCGVRLIDPWA
jgi:predicted nucleic acid-binding protein